jgi:hypothetical protein
MQTIHRKNSFLPTIVHNSEEKLPRKEPLKFMIDIMLTSELAMGINVTMERAELKYRICQITFQLRARLPGASLQQMHHPFDVHVDMNRKTPLLKPLLLAQNFPLSRW